ncbi:MAG: hypothetical protein OHK0039_20090 [Bacteroidia bacterium]
MHPVAPERQRAAYLHLAGLLGWLLPGGQVLLPLLLWWRWRSHPVADLAGRSVIDFQVSAMLGMLLCLLLTYTRLGIPLLLALLVYVTVASLRAGWLARQGVAYVYPLALRLLRRGAM